MLVELKENLQEIYSEVMTKLIPGNIKKDVTILNVTGTYGGGSEDTILDVSDATTTVSGTTLIFDNIGGTPILYNKTLYQNAGITINTYSVVLTDGEYVSSGSNNGKGVYITNTTGSSKTFTVKLYFENGSTDCYIQAGYGTGTLPTMISTGAGRTAFVDGYYTTGTNISQSYTVPNNSKFFIGCGAGDLPHIMKIVMS